MYVRDLSIHVSSTAPLPIGTSHLVLNSRLHHIQEAILLKLPARTNFANAAKLVIELAPSAVHRPEKQLNILVADVEFNLGILANYTPESDNLVADAVATAFLAMGVAFDALPDPLLIALEAARSQGFELEQRTRLSRRHRASGQTASVVRSVRRGGEDWRVDILDRSGSTEISYELCKHLGWFVALERFARSEWQGDTFKISDRQGNTTFAVALHADETAS